ncbi:hypothetical protein KHA90_23630 [Flavobacterium psychroterrae]|uniref:Uncharacterized protein n=1 Tax=Flavobacterium psychroterrae TaxID=2133767 RepID=A0ABS5PI86_9FLAO|nr:hypothetical protein [Flavobacterium psychroterrae]MBS7234002.1 hypothetical protein [Flavobacterium psychroterrae]
MVIPEALNTEKFAEHKDSIRILYLADDDFRIMCNDYCTSKIYIEKCKEKIQENAEYKVEYEHLFTELEKEILRYIKNNEI